MKDSKLTKHVSYTMSYTRFPGPYNNATVLFYCIVGLKYYGKGRFILYRMGNEYSVFIGMCEDFPHCLPI